MGFFEQAEEDSITFYLGTRSKIDKKPSAPMVYRYLVMSNPAICEPDER
jgi:hypothetical protein